MVNSAIILAGGLGTRLRTVVSDVPKPMAPINGRPFLEHQMDFWIKQGISRFVVSVGYRHEVITDYFGNRFKGREILYAFEETPLGTGGGLLLSANMLKDQEPILVLNGDTFFDVSLVALEQFHKKYESIWTISLFRATEGSRYMGVSIDPAGRIIKLKSGKANIGGLANGGVYLVNLSALTSTKFQAGEKLSLEDDLLTDLQNSGLSIFGLESKGDFIDIGIPDDYEKAIRIIDHVEGDSA